MRAASRISAGGAVLIAASIALASGESPQDVLYRSMVNGRNVALTAIIQQNSGPMSSQIKLEQQRSGYTRVTVLQPLSRQGVSSIDDGKRWVTLVPDERRLIVQDSPRREIANPKERIALAAKNYVFKFDRPARVAGQDALVVLALPRASEMPTRRYFIDKERSFLLRLELIENGKSTVVHDTKSVTYESGVDEKPFALNIASPVRQIHVKGPEEMPGTEAARRILGFTPVIPKKLPFGFVTQQQHIAGEDDKRFVAVRISDGLVHGTVYQWGVVGAAEPWPFDPKRGDVEFGGVRFKLACELAKPIAFKVLEGFVGAKRSTCLPQEPAPGASTLRETQTDGRSLASEEHQHDQRL